MRRFLLKLGLTAAAMLLAATALDALLTHRLRRSDARMFHTYNAILDGGLRCDAIVMGSSRGQVQYSTRILDSILGVDSYNLSVDGRAIDAEVTIYNLYRLHAPKPRLIIQNIDWLTPLMSNGYEREQYLPYLRQDSLYRMARGTEGFSWADRWLPLVRYAGYHEVVKEGLGIGNKLHRPAIYKGYVPHDDPWDGANLRRVDTVVFATNPTAVEILDGYLRRCREEGIQVVLVQAPLYIGLTQKMDPASDTVVDFFRRFADRYGFPLLDYSHDSLCLDTLNFYNSNHLNRRGAELFTTKLAHDLKGLIE